MKLILSGFLLGMLFQNICIAQKYADIENLKQKYSGEKAVILSDLENVTIEVENNSYKITENVTKETLLLQNTGDAFSTDQVYDSHFMKVKNIDAKTYIPEGKKFTVQKVDKFVETNNQSGNIFYDEVIKKTFVYPGVQPGAITSLSFDREVGDPRMLGSFFFKWHIPCELSKISIKADKRAGLKYKLFNVDPANIEFTRQEKGKYEILTWTARNIKAFDYESDAPNVRYYFPHIAYFIENQNPADTSDLNSKGLNGLYHYYYSLIKDLKTKDDSGLRQEVQKIINGASSEEEKVRRIFYWVQDHINYIAFEEGMQGFIPEPADQVYNKRYGDCKGMSNLIHTMLGLAGIKSGLTWIGTRDLPYKYSDINSAIVDDHMIVTYYHNGKPVFLDGTNNYLPYGLPSAMIQGKQALVGIDEKTYRIEDVPVIKNEENLYNDSTYFTIKDNKIEGTGFLSLTGFEKNQKTYYLSGKDKIREKERMLGILNKGNNKFFLDTFNISNLYDRDQPLNIKYKYHVNDYFRAIDREVYINLNLNKPYFTAEYDPEKRKVPVENDFSTKRKFVTVFEIPAGYRVSYLPKDQSGSCSQLQFTVSYKVMNNKVIQEKTVSDQFLLLEASDFEKWNKVIKLLDDAYKDVLILEKK